VPHTKFRGDGNRLILRRPRRAVAAAVCRYQKELEKLPDDFKEAYFEKIRPEEQRS